MFQWAEIHHLHLVGGCAAEGDYPAGFGHLSRMATNPARISPPPATGS